MALKYQSGELIQPGDRVTYGGNAGTIELVVEGATGVPETDWLFKTNGPGVMVAEPKVFGRVYLHDPHHEEDLLFVARPKKSVCGCPWERQPLKSNEWC
jgi:hypothetical protein